MSHTIKYKTGYIHITDHGTDKFIQVQINPYAYLVEVKSVHAAKLFITKHGIRR